MRAKPQVLEFGMGVDVHGRDAAKAACRAVSGADTIIACAAITVSVEYPEGSR